MQVASMNITELKAKALELEKQIKEIHAEQEAYNEEVIFNRRVMDTVYDGFVHPEFRNIWDGIKYHVKPEELGSIENYFATMEAQSIDGLTYNQVGYMLNLIEGTSVYDIGRVCEERTCNMGTALKIKKEIYQQMAVESWTGATNKWREEISAEKIAIGEKALPLMEEYNKIVDIVTKSKKKLSRAQRKAQNQN